MTDFPNMQTQTQKHYIIQFSILIIIILP